MKGWKVPSSWDREWSLCKYSNIEEYSKVNLMKGWCKID
jgi:hypothetical protein